MKKTTLIVLFFFITQINFSQSIGGRLYINQSYRTSINNGVSPEMKNFFDSIEHPSTRFSIGTNYTLSKIGVFEPKFGVGYTNIGDKDLWTLGSSLVSSDPNDPSIPYEFRFERYFHFLDLSAGGNLYIIDNAFKLFLSGDFEVNIPLFGKSVGYQRDSLGNQSSWTTQTHIPFLNLSFQTGLGLGYKIGNYMFYAQPTFKQMLLPIFSQANLNRKYYSYGVTLGLNYYF